MKRPQKLLLASIALALASWVVPVLALVTLPLQFLYTMLHEMGHALASSATGGHGISIKIFPDASGVTSSYDGWILAVAPAGYVGATLMGAVVLFMSRTATGAALAFRSLAIALGMAWIVYVRFDPIGMVICIVFGLLFWLVAIKMKGDGLAVLGQFVGAFLCLASLQAVFSTFGFGQVAMQENDAMILQRATGIPAVVSSLVWAVISAGAVGLGLHRAWKC